MTSRLIFDLLPLRLSLHTPVAEDSTLSSFTSSTSLSAAATSVQGGVSQSSSLPPQGNSPGDQSTMAASTHRNSRTPIIAGAVIGSVVGLCALGLVALKLLLRRRLRHQRPRSFNGDMMVRSSRNTSTSLPPYVHSATNSTSPLKNHDGMDEVPSSSSVARISAMNLASSRSGTPAVLGYDNDMKKSYHFPSVSEPPQFLPLTDRQMQLQERIHELQAKLINLNSGDGEWKRIEERLATLKALQTGEWAREVTDVAPPELAW